MKILKMEPKEFTGTHVVFEVTVEDDSGEQVVYEWSASASADTHPWAKAVDQ